MMYFAPIKIKPQSYLLCASGEGRANVNAEFIFDDYGFPYFSGRRFKGLLRESMIEVLEITGATQEQIETQIKSFFGVEGSATNDGLLIINNLHVQGWYEAVQYVKSQAGTSILSPSVIRKYFVSNVQQTSIDKKTGVAKDKSLRNYNVLNHLNASCFEGDLVSKVDLSQKQLQLLSRTCLHLRYGGTRRNRGFGKIKCEIDPFNQKVGSTANFELKKEDTTLVVNIKCLQNVVLSIIKGEQNTVYSDDHVAGNRLRGVLAGMYINKHRVDDDFKKLFLRGKLNYNPCYPENASPIPSCIRREKYEPTFSPVNILSETIDCDNPLEQSITKRVGGFINDSEKVKVKKSYQFHNSRPDRSAGRSVKDQDSGGIFYYESIAAGESFTGSITGSAAMLNLLVSKIGAENITYLGKSKSAQYGKIQLTLEVGERVVNNQPSKGDVYLVAQSPIVLLNENGYPEPSINALKQYLPDVEVLSTITQITTIEQFNTQWLSKSGKFFAFKEGSCFKIKASSTLPLIIGEWQEQGFGIVKVYTQEEINKQMEILKKEDQNSSISEITDQPVPKVIDSILKSQDENRRHTQIRLKAFKDSKFLQKEALTNSLIGRMNGILNYDETSIRNFLKDIASKQAGKILDKYLLLDQLNNFQRLENRYNNFKDYQVYWKAFFESLRLHNKNKVTV